MVLLVSGKSVGLRDRVSEHSTAWSPAPFASLSQVLAFSGQLEQPYTVSSVLQSPQLMSSMLNRELVLLCVVQGPTAVWVLDTYLRSRVAGAWSEVTRGARRKIGTNNSACVCATRGQEPSGAISCSQIPVWAPGRE